MDAGQGAPRPLGSRRGAMVHDAGDRSRTPPPGTRACRAVGGSIPGWPTATACSCSRSRSCRPETISAARHRFCLRGRHIGRLLLGLRSGDPAPTRLDLPRAAEQGRPSNVCPSWSTDSDGSVLPVTWPGPARPERRSQRGGADSAQSIKEERGAAARTPTGEPSPPQDAGASIGRMSARAVRAKPRRPRCGCTSGTSSPSRRPGWTCLSARSTWSERRPRLGSPTRPTTCVGCSGWNGRRCLPEPRRSARVEHRAVPRRGPLLGSRRGST